MVRHMQLPRVRGGHRQTLAREIKNVLNHLKWVDLLRVKPTTFAPNAQVVGAFAARDFPIVHGLRVGLLDCKQKNLFFVGAFFGESLALGSGFPLKFNLIC